jgi:hypothetical protein
MNLTETGYMVCIGLAQDRDKYQAPVYMIINLVLKQEVLGRIKRLLSFDKSKH